MKEFFNLMFAALLDPFVECMIVSLLIISLIILAGLQLDALRAKK